MEQHFDIHRCIHRILHRTSPYILHCTFSELDQYDAVLTLVLLPIVFSLVLHRPSPYKPCETVLRREPVLYGEVRCSTASNDTSVSVASYRTNTLQFIVILNCTIVYSSICSTGYIRYKIYIVLTVVSCE